MSFRVIEKQVVFRGKRIQLEVHRLEDEESGKMTQREIVMHPGSVVILPFLNKDEVILIRNRRYAAGQPLVELPAGTLEKGEDPINCAGRELQEETGYLAGRLKPIGSFFSSPGIISEKLYAFAAYDLENTTRGLDEGEEIEVTPVPYSEALEMIRTGAICDAKTIAVLLMYDRFHRAPPPELTVGD
jgi:ADP-ribose pyrophosphatase